MKKESIVLIVVLILIFYSSVYYFNKDKKVCFEENCFFVELSKTQNEKAEGLMFRESLGQDKGMLFIYDEEGKYSFWMKNTLIPLDIIWINSEKEVVHIQHNAQPCIEECGILSPEGNTKFVLEINGGMSNRLNIGDKIKFINIE